VRAYETTVVVAAPPEVVWRVTSAIENWPSWSPTMTRVERLDTGSLRVGSTARVHQPKLSPATWEVDEVDPKGAFVWHTGAQSYQVRAVHRWRRAGDGTEVSLVAEMTGPFAWLLWPLTGRTIRRYLDQEAAALKVECERSSQ
jgi:uncharacterized membrane protein